MQRHLPFVAISWTIFTVACSQRPVPQELLNDLRATEQKERITIGWVYQQRELNVIAFRGKPEMETFSVTTAEGQKIAALHEKSVEIGNGKDAMRSPDGRSMTFRSNENKFLLADANGRVQRTLLDGKTVVTPLQWSPDSRYLMYVQKGGVWDSAALRCGDDVFYVMVYRLSDSRNGSVLQVCQGYPYWDLQWIQLPPRVPV